PRYHPRLTDDALRASRSALSPRPWPKPGAMAPPAVSGGAPGKRYPRRLSMQLRRVTTLGVSDSGEITRRPGPPARTLRARSWLRSRRPRRLRHRRLVL